MFQPRVKLEFVRRYCAPTDGWCVCVDMDSPEEGRTGGERENESARQRQIEMKAHARSVSDEFRTLRVRVGNRKQWCMEQGLHYFKGDPDIVAFDRFNRRCLVAEVEGASSGQPEQKLYKAIGQIVRTASHLPGDWQCHLMVVIYGEQIARHLLDCKALEKLEIAALHLQNEQCADRWLFGASWMDASHGLAGNIPRTLG